MKIIKMLPSSWVVDEEYDEDISEDVVFRILESVYYEAYRDNSGCFIFRDYNRAPVSIGSRQVAAYRVMCMLFNGFVWPEPECRHLCNNPKCVNPAHLWHGDKLDQKLDSSYQFSGVELAPKDWSAFGFRSVPSVAAIAEQNTAHADMMWEHFIEWAYDNGLGPRLMHILSTPTHAWFQMADIGEYDA